MASRRLTQLQRRILLNMLKHEEETKEEKLGFERAMTPGYAARLIMAEVEREKNPSAPNDAEEIFGNYLLLGAKEIGTVAIRYKYLNDSIIRCMKRMERCKLVLPVTIPLKRRSPLIAYRLSPWGRLLAKMLRFEKSGKAKVDAMADELIEKAVKALREEKTKAGQPPYATAIEMLEKLWQLSPGLYENERTIFNRHWNKKRLGSKMSKDYRLAKKVMNGKRVWVYELYSRK